MSASHITRRPRALLLAILAMALATPAVTAQSGVHDQMSPTPGTGQWANFAVSDPAQVWQQQVRAGVAGRLSAVRLQLTGPATARALLRIRPAAGWSQAAPVFQTWLQKSAPGAEHFLVDTSSANFQLAVGQRFVLELQGDGSLAGVNGSYVPASQGAPEYAEPLFLSGPGCYGSCGWRIGFETWVSNGDVTEFCPGSGCPCSNDAAPGGCANSTGAGARLVRSAGTTGVAANDLQLGLSGLPAQVSTMLFMGPAQMRAPLGDGLRCAGGSPRRIQLALSSAAGTLTFDQIVLRAGGLATVGSTWHLQAWYRDPSGPCQGGYNLSSALQVVFAP